MSAPSARRFRVIRKGHEGAGKTATVKNMVHYYNPNATAFTYLEPVYVAPTGIPTVNVTVSKSRRKVHQLKNVNTVFLKDGEEFELELFNPTTRTVGARVLMNGEAISNRVIILRPGQRFFLERYLDVANRFKFSSYEVEGGDAAVTPAIAKNGNISVEFYYEKPKPKPVVQRHPPHYGVLYSRSVDFNPTLDFAPEERSRGFNLNLTTSSVGAGSATYSANTKSVSMDSLAEESFGDVKMQSAPTVHTGRVEEGSRSDMEFRSVSMEFESYPMATVNVKMEPIENTPVETTEIRVYCTQCGRKQKPGEKFCPNDGTKYD